MKSRIVLIACLLINQSPLAAESWWENNQKSFIWVAGFLAWTATLAGLALLAYPKKPSLKKQKNIRTAPLYNSPGVYWGSREARNESLNNEIEQGLAIQSWENNQAEEKAALNEQSSLENNMPSRIIKYRPETIEKFQENLTILNNRLKDLLISINFHGKGSDNYNIIDEQIKNVLKIREELVSTLKSQGVEVE